MTSVAKILSQRQKSSTENALKIFKKFQDFKNILKMLDINCIYTRTGNYLYVISLLCPGK